MTEVTVYQRIVRAAHRGTGLRLSAEQVATLAADSAISAVAEGDDEAARSALEDLERNDEH